MGDHHHTTVLGPEPPAVLTGDTTFPVRPLTDQQRLALGLCSTPQEPLTHHAGPSVWF